MAIKINFDSTHNVEEPILVLASRNGEKIDTIPATNLSFEGSVDVSNIVFKVYKTDCCNKYKGIDENKGIDLWEQIKDFKLLWVKDWNKWFEITVEVNESDETVKSVSAVSLGKAELSQILIYGLEVNTEDDISRDDYIPTVLFEETNPKASLLNRVLSKAPHYKINHVDASIASIQRSFSFDGISIDSIFSEISEELNCVFIIDCYSDNNNKLIREVNVYDLESYCLDCGHRGEFENVCPECNGTNIRNGYGEDTTIFVSSDNLADGIEYVVDSGSVKNCFKLEAGDELMTATVRNCNPNGSGYIWYISEDMKSDMPENLVNKLNLYDADYAYYQNENTIIIPTELCNEYNNLILKYREYSADLPEIEQNLIGFPKLMQTYYNITDFYYYLNNVLMPSIEIVDTTAQNEANKLAASIESGEDSVAVQDKRNISVASATSAVLSFVKTIIDPRYKVKTKDEEYIEVNNVNSDVDLSLRKWRGKFIISSYADESDFVETGIFEYFITDVKDDNGYEEYVKQRIDKFLTRKDVADVDVAYLFNLDKNAFIAEIKKYCYVRLKSFLDSCQACLDILIEQGISDKDIWGIESGNAPTQSPDASIEPGQSPDASTEPGQSPDIPAENGDSSSKDLYSKMYTPYYEKINILKEELKLREEELATINGKYENGEIVKEGVKSYLERKRNAIQNELNFEKYLGNDLWLEFIAYQREDTYTNKNYVSDGLDNAQLFKRALEFMDVAKREIVKSATLQHSITASLKNLLVMKEFAPIVDKFELFNWIRIKVDEQIYKLRLIGYTINFDELSDLRIEFSDVMTIKDGISDVESILQQASSMATSYNSVSRQASQGEEGNKQLKDWVSEGLALTNMKIIDNAENQGLTLDSHGILCKEYLPITDSYDSKQLKIINKGLFLTDDNWETSKAGIGNFNFYNPETKKMEEGYGVIANTLIGNLVLSEKIGIYNDKNSIAMGEDGFVLTTTSFDSTKQTVFKIQKKEKDAEGNINTKPILYVDTNGNLVLDGSIKVKVNTDDGVNSIDDLANTDNRLSNSKVFRDTITGKYQEAIAESERQLSDYKAELGQYIMTDENGLTLGAKGSPFKTILDNQRLCFKEGDYVVSYISNRQLYVPGAIIENYLKLGNYFACPKPNGGFTVTYQSNI